MADVSRYPRSLQRFRLAALIVLFFITPLAQVAVTRIVPAGIGVGLLILLAGHLIHGGRYFEWAALKRLITFAEWKEETRWLGWLISAFLGWSMITLLWSPQPLPGFLDIIAVGAVIPLAALLIIEFSSLARQHIRLALIVGLSAAALLLILEINGATQVHLLDDDVLWLYHLNRCAVLLAILVWTVPLTTPADGPWRWLTIIPFFFVALALVYTQSQAAQLAFLGAALTGLILSLLPMLRLAAYSAIAVAMLAVPFSLPVLEDLTRSLPGVVQADGHTEHRLVIWKAYSETIKTRPVVGGGMRADRVIGKDELAERSDITRFNEPPTHPHNFILEIWTNLGLIGAALAAAIIGTVGLITGTMARRHARLTTQVFGAAFVYASTGASAVQVWWLAIIVLVFTVFGLTRGSNQMEQ